MPFGQSPGREKSVRPAARVKNGLVQPRYSKEISFIIMPLAARSCIRATTKKAANFLHSSILLQFFSGKRVNFNLAG